MNKEEYISPLIIRRITGTVIGCSKPYFSKIDGNKIYKPFYACFISDDGKTYAYASKLEIKKGVKVSFLSGNFYEEIGLKTIDPSSETEVDLADIYDWDAGTCWIDVDETTSF